MNFGTTTSSGYTFPIGSITNPGGVAYDQQIQDGIASSLSNAESDSVLASLYASDTPDGALQWLKANNPEVYYQLLAERSQNQAFWDDYKKYQEDYYSIQKASLKKAGMNPWLALQNFGSIGTGSVGSSSAVNPTNTLKAQREAKSQELLKGVGVAGIGLIGAILGLLMMAL